MASFLESIFLKLNKKKLTILENIDLSQYLNTTKVNIIKEPFPHFVVDNFFKPEYEKKIRDFFTSRLNRGLSEVYDNNRFFPFLDLKGDFEYDGYKYAMFKKEDISELNIFFSLAWNQFFSKAFNQPTSTATSMALHYHSVGDRTGFIHHDYASKPFFKGDILENGVIYRTREGMPPRPDYFNEMRIIAVLYYFGNDNWKEGDGGGTGVYFPKNNTPYKVVEPKNNRIFAFQISPKSFHAFQSNKKPRPSIVQWFHVNKDWCDKTYGQSN